MAANPQTNTPTSQELELKRTQSLVKAYDRFTAFVQKRAQEDAGNAREELEEDQMQRIITAETEEEMEAALNMAGLVGLRTLDDGTEIRILSFRFAPGSNEQYANKLGVFVIMRVVLLATGQEISVDCGVERIIAALDFWARKDMLPIDRIVKKIRTGSGNDMITLAKLPTRAVKN
jgi:hypothetical protein